MNKIEQLDKDLETSKTLLTMASINSCYFKLYDLGKDIKILKAEKDALEYWLQREPTGKAMLGKYFYFCVEYDDGWLRCALWKNNDEYERVMYDCSFGSHSGINEFADEIFLPFIASVSDSSYSHAFGSADVTQEVRYINNFSKRVQESIFKESDADNLKRSIDAICMFADNKTVADAADKIFESYIESMKKFYKGE